MVESAAPDIGSGVLDRSSAVFLAAGNGAGQSDLVLQDLYLEFGAARDLSLFYDGGDDIDWSTIGSPQFRMGGTQTATDINAGTNLGSGASGITITGTFTDV